MGTACLLKMVFDHCVRLQRGLMCPSHLNYSSNCHIVRETETGMEGRREVKEENYHVKEKTAHRLTPHLSGTQLSSKSTFAGYIAKDQKEATLHLLPVYSYTQF